MIREHSHQTNEGGEQETLITPIGVITSFQDYYTSITSDNPIKIKLNYFHRGTFLKLDFT